jgi:hypothetical protein
VIEVRKIEAPRAEGLRGELLKVEAHKGENLMLMGRALQRRVEATAIAEPRGVRRECPPFRRLF